MSDVQIDELSLYRADHRAWRCRAAPRIAAVLAASDDDTRLLESWSMLKAETKEAVWELLDNPLRTRIKKLCNARPQVPDTPVDTKPA
jgi:hypothetical protein